MFILLFTYLVFILCSYAFYDKSSGVISLDKDNFDTLVGVNENEVSIVEFYAPWCGHCQQLKPEYVKVANQLKNLVKVYAVDASDEKNKAIAQRFQIQGFPTIKIFVGDKAQDYQGERTADALKTYALSLLPSYLKKVNDKNLDKFLETDKDKIPRALILTKKSNPSPTIKRLSSIFKNHMNIGEVNKKNVKNISKKYDVNVDENSILLVFSVNNTENPIMYTGNPKSFRQIVNFLAGFTPGIQLEDEDDKLPELYDESCFQQICVKKGLCVILIRGNNDEEFQRIYPILKEVEESSSSASLFSFSILDGNNNSQWVSSMFNNDFNLDYPNIVILSPQKKAYAHYVGSYSKESLEGFINGILNGKTRITSIRINEIPKLSTETEKCKPKEKPKSKTSKDKSDKSDKSKSQSNSKANINDWKNAQPGQGSPFLVHLTPHNFNDIIMDSNQPAIIEFYAPWCGHCKSLAPQYALAANNLKGMVIFGGVDCNDEKNRPLCAQYGIQGFPTLKIFPVGQDRKKAQGVKDYTGPRQAKDIEQAALDTLYSIKVPILVNQNDYEEFLNNANNGGVKLLLFTDKTTPPSMLRALKAKFDNVNFGMITKKQTQLLERLKVTEFPTIYGYTTTQSEPILYTGEKSFIALNEFVEQLLEDQVDSNTHPHVKIEL